MRKITEMLERILLMPAKTLHADSIPYIFMFYLMTFSLHQTMSQIFPSFRWMTNELDGMWMGAVMAELGYYNGISLERLRKTTRNLSHCSHYVIQDSNQTPPELKLEGLLPEATWLVSSKNITIRHYFLQFSLMCIIPIVSIQICQQTISLYTTLYDGDLKNLHVSVV